MTVSQQISNHLHAGANLVRCCCAESGCSAILEVVVVSRKAVTNNKTALNWAMAPTDGRLSQVELRNAAACAEAWAVIVTVVASSVQKTPPGPGL